jgi:hypothetical protein
MLNMPMNGSYMATKITTMPLGVSQIESHQAHVPRVEGLLKER